MTGGQIIPVVPPAQAAASAALRVSPGALAAKLGLLFVSGQVGQDATGAAIADPQQQYAAAFEAVRSVLSGAGADFRDVVELVTYHVSFDDFDVFCRVKDAYISGPVFPAWTAVGVTTLAAPNLLVEVKCTAIADPERQA